MVLLWFGVRFRVMFMFMFMVQGRVFMVGVGIRFLLSVKVWGKGLDKC